MGHGDSGGTGAFWSTNPGTGQGVHRGNVDGGTVILTTGPLAIDEELQRSVGVIVENNGPCAITATIRLFNKSACPKELAVETPETVEPGCVVAISFDNPGFFYEAQVELPGLFGVLVTVYGLTALFRPIAANTLHHSQLVVLPGTDLNGAQRTPAAGTQVAPTPAGAWSVRKRD